MDLTLRGSQINLAARDKPKTPIVKYPASNRPRSANCSVFQRSFPSVRRPFSADQKLSYLDDCIKFSETLLKEEKFRKNKKFWSTSSATLFRFLLDEPIKKSWCNKDPNSESLKNLGHQISDITKSNNVQLERVEALNAAEEFNGSTETETNQRSSNIIRKREVHTKDLKLTEENLENPKVTEMSKGTNFGSSQTTANSINSRTDFWNESKPHMPGRVSFGRTAPYELDHLSDCDNENHTEITDFRMNNKKTVHFGTSVELPKCSFDLSNCSSENCSCVAPSLTSTYDIQSEKPKCMCEFACNSCDYTNLSSSTKSYKPQEGTSIENSGENEIIKQYQDVVHENNFLNRCNSELLNTNGERMNTNIQSELNSETVTNCFHNDAINSDFDSFKENQLNANYSAMDTFQQNNLSEIRPNNYSFSNKNLSNKNHIFNCKYSSPSESPNPVIKNYIQVSKTPIMSRKHKNSAPSKKIKKISKSRRSKSASAGDSIKKPKSKLYKTSTYCCLREDSNLDEFELDKIDSWMSLQSHSNYHRCHAKDVKPIRKYSPEDYEDNETTESPEPSKSEEASPDSSTYDEIVSVIKEIEEDKKKDEPLQNNVNIDLKLQALLQSDLPNTSATSTKNSPDSPDKLKDILSYLDDVENSCEKAIDESRRSIPESIRSEIEFIIEPDIVEDVPKLGDLLMLPNHQLARKVVSLTLRANELANAIHLSKEHVMRIKLERQKSLRGEKQNGANRLREQKNHYETVVARHQGFIEQLLKDKASLCEKVTALTRRIDSQNQAWEHKLVTEVSRVKETTLAGEKIRRERWTRENTKKIKELTVKGVEIEINNMNTNHQRQITELKRRHQEELLDALEEARLKYEEMEKSIRETHTKDREATIEKERNAIRERFDRQLQEEQKSFDEQRSKLLEDLACERERLYKDMKQKENEFQTKLQELHCEKEITLEREKLEYQDKLEHQEQKYQNRINTIEKQYESDFLIWKREFENACKLREVESENAIRQHYRTERDRQIDVIVSRMDAESEKHQEDFEMKLNRMKEKYEDDLREAESVEKSLREKYNDVRGKLAESDAQVQNLLAEIRQLQLELEHSKKMCDEFLIEKEEMRENLRNEVQQEIAAIKTERDNEIQKIHKRVQQAIEKKDSTLDLVQKENANLRERCLKLEAVVRQQRKDYCIK